MRCKLLDVADVGLLYNCFIRTLTAWRMRKGPGAVGSDAKRLCGKLNAELYNVRLRGFDRIIAIVPFK